jgi:serine/threonine protein phosphatase 1
MYRGVIDSLRRRLADRQESVRDTEIALDVKGSSSTPIVYAIGDIHGRMDLLLQIETRIRDDLASRAPARAILVTLGDYVDRGAQSRQVLEHLATRPSFCSLDVHLRGNHEEVLLEFLRDATVLDAWSRFGGLETLVSYGLRPSLPLTPESLVELRLAFAAALPQHHLDFLQKTRLCFETATHYFAHAGINPATSLAQQKPQDLLWIRDEFLASSRRFEKIIVHGHTPTAAPEVLPNRVNLDTGAYITGKLTCGVFDGRSCRILST